jgi:hypothetical protein
MNLHEQIGALEAGVDQLLVAATARASRTAEAAPADPPAAARTAAADVTHANAGQPQAQADAPADAGNSQAVVDANVEAVERTDTAEASAADPEAATEHPESAEAGPALLIGRPSQNEITMTIGEHTVSLNPLQVGQLIEELANARASMQPEPPPGIPPGWRFASTKNPVMAVQKQSNGDRLLVLRHTGHGWVPFTFSPDIVVQLYMMLTQR